MFDLNGQWNRKINADDCRFARPKTGQEFRRRRIQLPAGRFTDFSVCLVNQAMNNQSPHLTQDAGGDVPRLLSRQHEVHPELPPFLRNLLERIERLFEILLAEMPIKEIVRLIIVITH